MSGFQNKIQMRNLVKDLHSSHGGIMDSKHWIQEHPTVADNFQSGIPHSGGIFLSSGQEDTLAMFMQLSLREIGNIPMDNLVTISLKFSEPPISTTNSGVPDIRRPGQKQSVIDRSLVLIYQNVQEIQDSSFTAGNLKSPQI